MPKVTLNLTSNYDIGFDKCYDSNESPLTFLIDRFKELKTWIYSKKTLKDQISSSFFKTQTNTEKFGPIIDKYLSKLNNIQDQQNFIDFLQKKNERYTESPPSYKYGNMTVVPKDVDKFKVKDIFCDLDRIIKMLNFYQNTNRGNVITRENVMIELQPLFTMLDEYFLSGGRKKRNKKSIRKEKRKKRRNTRKI